MGSGEHRRGQNKTVHIIIIIIIRGGEPLGERGVIRNDILLSVPKHYRIHIAENPVQIPRLY